MQANKAFAVRFKGDPNFMTPEIVERGTTGKYHWEISRGRGIFTDTIWGVTFLHLDSSRPKEDVSTMVYSYPEALDHIERVCGKPPA